MAPRFAFALIDLNGTLHVGSRALPGAVEALRRLRSSGVSCLFVTNTTKTSSGRLLREVQALGLDVREGEVFSSLAAARRLVERRGLSPDLLLENEALEEFFPAGRGPADREPHDAVVVGLAPAAFNYVRLNSAFRVLEADPAAPLIAVHRGVVLRDGSDGGLSLGPGPFVAALEAATGREAEVVGKPSAAFFGAALDALDADPERAVMIGDDWRDDVLGAQLAGVGAGVLVRTGKYRPGDEERAERRPDRVVDDFAQAVEWILGEA